METAAKEKTVARRKLEPTIGGSTYISPDKLEWKPTRFEKVSLKVLYEDKEKGEMTCMIKLEPGRTFHFTNTPN